MAAGNPNAITLVYSIAKGSTLSVEPKNKSIGFIKTIPITPIITPIISISVVALPM